MKLDSISIDPTGTHHLLAGRPLYQPRFHKVLSFHPPGLAAVTDTSGAYHITTDGQPAYPARFLATFGFYAGRAAVNDDTGWFHIRETGAALYCQRYAWCGNYQQGRAPVRENGGLYYHLDPEGNRVYQQAYLYVGDYRDGIACARQNTGLCTHIDLSGHLVHPKHFLDLDVFHKGFARARDHAGWFHIRPDGTAAYAARFADIEPFYNGQAFARTHEGCYVLVNESGSILHDIWPAQESSESLSTRAKGCLTAAGIPLEKQAVVRALRTGVLSWRTPLYGKYTHRDVCRWLGLDESFPLLSAPQGQDQPFPANGLSYRANGLLRRAGIAIEKSAVRQALETGALVPRKRPYGYGEQTHAELCRWADVDPSALRCTRRPSLKKLGKPSSISGLND